MYPILRPYQEITINSLRNSIRNGNKRIILCSPTGSGKTMMFSYMVAQAVSKGRKALILTDRVELLKQANGSFTRFGLSPISIEAGKEPDLTKQLHVGMIETIYRRAERYKNFLSSRSFIILDEAHKTAFEKIFPYISASCVVIGATATPQRSGKQQSLSSFYSDIVQTIDTPDLISLGFLSEAFTYGVDIDLSDIKKKGGDYDNEQLGRAYSERKIYDGVIENYNKICPGTKALLFAPNIESSKEVCRKLQRAHLPALHLDSEMSKQDREYSLSVFREMPNAILCNVGILTTGFDCPDIETIILYRATTSLPLFLQMVGRGSRITETKKRFSILDFGNNIKTHDFWESPRTWSLEKKEKKTKVPPIKSCPKCNALLPASAKSCKYCGHEIPLTAKEIKEKEFAELKLLSRPALFSHAAKADIKGKAEMAKAKLISPFWVLHSLTSRAEADLFCNEMGYKPGFAYHNKDRFKVFQDG